MWSLLLRGPRLDNLSWGFSGASLKITSGVWEWVCVCDYSVCVCELLHVQISACASPSVDKLRICCASQVSEMTPRLWFLRFRGEQMQYLCVVVVHGRQVNVQVLLEMVSWVWCRLCACASLQTEVMLGKVDQCVYSMWSVINESSEGGNQYRVVTNHWIRNRGLYSPLLRGKSCFLDTNYSMGQNFNIFNVRVGLCEL